MRGPEVMLLGRGDGHLAAGKPFDTPFPTEQQPLTPLADGGCRGTASGFASSEAKNDRGFCCRRGMRGGARERFHSHGRFRNARP
jgi:hypothetical protein